MQKKLIILLVFLFLFRLLFGLCSEFWFDDELQIYLIGLKSYTTGSWPYYGPDIVYTNTQIAGGLQGLLVSIPFYISATPEAPIVFLNLLSFFSLSFLGYYVTKRTSKIPSWLVYTLILITPWAMHYSTRVVNPSYALVFAIPFFISLLELLPIYSKKIMNPNLAFLILGISTTSIMQLHMSWVLLLPLTGFVFLFRIRKKLIKQIKTIGIYLLGLFIGILTLIPTLLLTSNEGPSTLSNVLFNPENWSNLPIIVLRFFSFAGNEIPYVLGGNTEERLSIVQDQIWSSPFVIFLLLVGFLQIGLFIYLLIKPSAYKEFTRVKLLVIASLVLLYCSFFFSIKGPASHTFYIFFPLAICYAFYCYEWLVGKYKPALKILKAIAISSLIFHLGLGLYNLEHKSLYKNREKVTRAIEKMDYKELGKRRTDEWGYGF